MKIRRGSILASSLALALAGPVAADAATHSKNGHRHGARAASDGATGSTGSNGHAAETPLTGSTLSSASSAALAAVPGTVSSATTETDGSGAYEVIVTKSDGSRVKVVENASFSVLSSTTTSCR